MFVEERWDKGTSWAQIMQRIMVSYPDHGSGYKNKYLPSHKTATKKYLSILDGDLVCILRPGPRSGPGCLYSKLLGT